MGYKQYGDYKKSEIHWAMQIPTHWNMSKLKRIFKFEKGKNSNVLTEEYVKSNEGPYPVYSGQTKNNGILGFIDSYEYDFKNNVILVTTVGAKAMTTFLIKDKLSLSQNCALIKLKSDDDWSDYYYYLCKILFNYERGLIPDIMQPSLRIGDLNMYNIIKPPLEEQKQIANFLGKKTAKIDATIAKNEELIQLLEEKRVALINQVVTKGLNPDVPMKDSGVEWIGEIPKHWDVVPFKRLFDNIKDGTHGSFQRVADGEPLLSAKNVFNDSINMSENESLIGQDDYNSIVANGFPKRNDILLTIVGTIGRSCVYDKDYPLAFQRSVAFIRLTQDNPYFYNYFLKSDIFYSQLMINAKESAQKGVYLNDIKECLVIRPPIEMQSKIADYLFKNISKIDKTISKIQENINLLDEYKTSLIHHVVTGKIDVRGEDI